MANTITKSKNVINLSAMDSNYLWSESLPGHVNGVPVFAVMFRAGSTSANTLILRDGGTAGAIFLSVTLAATVTETFPLVGAMLRPAMLYSEQTFTTGAMWSFLFGRN